MVDFDKNTSSCLATNGQGAYLQRIDICQYERQRMG